jgi:hypothetical protein
MMGQPIGRLAFPGKKAANREIGVPGEKSCQSGDWRSREKKLPIGRLAFPGKKAANREIGVPGEVLRVRRSVCSDSVAALP